MTAAKRASLFRAFVAEMPRPLKVLDLGGSHEMWRRWGLSDADGLHITLANDHVADSTHRHDAAAGTHFVDWHCDVRMLEPGDCGRFDVVFSNSMLEHLSTREQQQRLARTILGSGKPFFIQVPNRRCLVDPHFPHPLAAFFGVWPKELQAWMLTKHGLGGLARPYKSIDYGRQRMMAYWPLDRRQLAELFPGASIVTQWNVGLPLSLIARRA